MKILNWIWRSGRDTVGIVLVECDDGKKRTYMGVATGITEEGDAHLIADHGARLAYHEALAFFPALKVQEYGNESI